MIHDGCRLNFFSDVCDAATILLLDWILRRLRVGPGARLDSLVPRRAFETSSKISLPNVDTHKEKSGSC